MASDASGDARPEPARGPRLESRVHALLLELAGPRPPGTRRYHEIHRELRRIRLMLSVVGQLMTPGGRSGLRHLDRELRHVSRLVGEVRDRDVGVRLLRAPPSAGGDRALRRRVQRLHQRLLTEARIGRTLLRAHANAALAGRLPERIERHAEARAASPLVGWVSAVRAERKERVQALRTAFMRADLRPSVRRLHRLRGRLRTLRLLDEALAPESSSVRFPVELRSVIRRIGDLHDVGLLEERLEGVDGRGIAGDWRRTVRRQRRRQQKRTARLVRASRTRRAVVAILRAPRPRSGERGASRPFPRTAGRRS